MSQASPSPRLRHSSDSEPGFTRKRQGRHWAYFDTDGKRITDRDTIERLNAVGLPPAYEQAWFCADDNGHLQATGVDARGRKQYRYHANFRAKAEASKFEGLTDFAKALPKIRRKVDRDLRKRALTREKVVAAVVRLLDTEHIRVGNDQYAKANKSFGATTLLTRHVKSKGRRVKMRFAGKHGVLQEVTITDRTLGRIVRQLQDLPGQPLFQYINGDGLPHAVSSADVNEYIGEATGGEFTAKHFRTWAASVIALDKLMAADEEHKVSVATVCEAVAEALGNTPAVSRKSYIHPELIRAAKEYPRDPVPGLERARPRKWLSAEEVALAKFLKTPRRRTRRAA
jgi:DNA topoisomerase-1